VVSKTCLFREASSGVQKITDHNAIFFFYLITPLSNSHLLRFNFYFISFRFNLAHSLKKNYKTHLNGKSYFCIIIFLLFLL
jgi:hypothetical protein